MISNRWKLALAALPIIGTLAVAQPQPGGLGGFFSQWYGKTQVIAAFSPADIADLEGWWDASDADTISLVAGTNRVSEWRDKSGLDRHFTQGTAAQRPYYDVVQNGLDAISIKGAETMTYNTADQSVWRFIHTNKASVFVAFKIYDVPENTNIISAVLTTRQSTGANTYGFAIEYEDRLIVGSPSRLQLYGGRRGGPTYSYLEDDYFTFGSSEIMGVVVDSTNATAASRLFIYDETNTRINTDNTNTGSSTDPTSSDLGFGYLGLNYLSMEIYEIIIYSKQVTEEERDDLIFYLTYKWGIP